MVHQERTLNQLMCSPGLPSPLHPYLSHLLYKEMHSHNTEPGDLMIALELSYIQTTKKLKFGWNVWLFCWPLILAIAILTELAMSDTKSS